MNITRRNGAVVYTRTLYRGCNIQICNYEQAKARYESITPIGGVRGKLGGDFRPATDRYRTWEVFMRDGDDYGIGFYSTFIAYDHTKDESGKTISKPKELHGKPKPMLMFSPDGTITYTPQWASSYTTWEFLSAALPPTLRFAKYGAKQYMEVAMPDGGFKYYLVSRSDIHKTRFVPYESNGKVYYNINPYDVIQEKKLLLDKDKTKKVREELDAFLSYYNIMSGLVCADIGEDNLGNMAKHMARSKLERPWLIREEGEEYGVWWVDAVKSLFILKSRISHTWNRDTGKWGEVVVQYATMEDILEIPMRQIYQWTKPYRLVAVEVGVGFRDNGREL